MYCFASPPCSPISGMIKYTASVLHFKLLILMALDFKLLDGVGIENEFFVVSVGWLVCICHFIGAVVRLFLWLWLCASTVNLLGFSFQLKMAVGSPPSIYTTVTLSI